MYPPDGSIATDWASDDTNKRGNEMKTYVAEIDGEAIATFPAKSEAHANREINGDDGIALQMIGMELPDGQPLWKAGDSSDASPCYESGVRGGEKILRRLRFTYSESALDWATSTNRPGTMMTMTNGRGSKSGPSVMAMTPRRAPSCRALA
jgi:hypothetical protein